MFLSAYSIRSQNLEDILWISEEHAPQNYRDGVRPAGVSVEVLLALWEALGLDRGPGNILVYPWNRGYALLEQGPGVSLFAMSMTEERKKAFRFVGPCFRESIVVMAKKEKASVPSLWTSSPRSSVRGRWRSIPGMWESSFWSTTIFPWRTP